MSSPTSLASLSKPVKSGRNTIGVFTHKLASLSGQVGIPLVSSHTSLASLSKPVKSGRNTIGVFTHKCSLGQKTDSTNSVDVAGYLACRRLKKYSVAKFTNDLFQFDIILFRIIPSEATVGVLVCVF